MENAFVLLGFFGALFFFFPFLTEGTFLYRQGKLGFTISLFSFWRLFGGYTVVDRDGITVHYSEKKAIFLPFKNLKEEQKMMDWRQGFQLYSLSILSELDKSKETTIPLAVIGETGIRMFFDKLKAKHPFLYLKSDLLLSEDNTSFCVRGKVIFNAFTITRAAIKIIIGRVITALWKKRRKTMKN